MFFPKTPLQIKLIVLNLIFISSLLISPTPFQNNLSNTEKFILNDNDSNIVTPFQAEVESESVLSSPETFSTFSNNSVSYHDPFTFPEYSREIFPSSTSNFLLSEPINTLSVFEGETVKVDHESKNSSLKSYIVEDETLSLDGYFGDSVGGAGELDYITAIDLQANLLFVAGHTDELIKVYDVTSREFLYSFGSHGTGNGQFNNIKGITVSKNRVYATDNGVAAGRVQYFTLNGEYLGQWGSVGSGDGQFSFMYNIASHPISGNIYVADYGNDRIQAFDTDGTFLWKQTVIGAFGVCVDADENIYTLTTYPSDYYIKKFSSSGSLLDSESIDSLCSSAYNLAYSPYFDRLFIPITDPYSILVYTTDLDADYSISSEDLGFSPVSASSIVTSASGDIFIGDTTGSSSKRIQHFKMFKETNTISGLQVIDIETFFSAAVIYQKLSLRLTSYYTPLPDTFNFQFTYKTSPTDIYGNVFLSETTQGSLSISSVYGEDELVCSFVLERKTNTTSYNFSCYDTGLNTLVSDTGSVTQNTNYSTYSILTIEDFFIESREISSNIRSHLQYVSETTIKHTLEVQVFDKRQELNIYAPLSWNLTTITPSAAFEWDDTNDYWVITETVDVTYEFFFLSGTGWGVDYARQNQFLAISDHSFDYLQNQGFENGWSDDWHLGTSSSSFNVSLSTDVVYDGAFSVHFEDSDTQLWFMSSLTAGYYYISFAYYFVEFCSFERFYWKNNGWNYIDLDETPNRWNLFFAYIQIDDDETIQFYTCGDGEFYLDNFKVWKANPSITTQGYSENLIEAQMISWDGYQNPSASNIETTLQLRDRCDNNLIKEWSLTTDVNGVASTTFRGTLEAKEYSLFVVANSADAYNPLDFDSSDFSSTVDYSPTLQGGVQLYTTEGIGGSGYFDGVNDYVDYTSTFFAAGTDEYTVAIWFKTDTTTASRHCILESTTDWAFSIELTSSHYITAYASTTATHGSVTSAVAYNDDVWHHVAVTYLEGDAFRLYVDGELKDTDTLISGSIDAAPSAHLGTYRTANGRWFEGYLDEFRFYEETLSEKEIIGIYNLNIPNAKRYFTPLTAGSIRFDEPSNHLFDFTEGTVDHFEYAINSANNGVEDGYLWYESSGATTHGLGTTSWGGGTNYWEEIIDLSYYNTLSFRAKSNCSGSDATFTLRLDTHVGEYVNGETVELDTYWQTFVFDISAYTQDSDGLAYWMTSSSIDPAQLVKIDWIDIYHSDSSLSGGYEQNFNEDDYLEECEASASTISVNGGTLQITTTGEYEGVYFRNVEQDIYSQGLTKILLKAKTDQSTSQRWYLSIMEFDHTYIDLVYNEIYLTSEYQIIEMTLAESFGCFRLLSYTGTTTAQTVTVDWIKIVSETPPNLYKTPSSYFITSENNTLEYDVWNDALSLGSYFDQEHILINNSGSSHTFSYVAFNDHDQVSCYLPSTFYYTTYLSSYDGDYVYDPSWKTHTDKGQSVTISHSSYDERSRSYYYYVSQTIKQHFLEFYSLASEDSLTIYLPLEWDSISVYPAVDYEFVDNNLVLTNILTDTYFLVTAFSGTGYGRDYVRQNQFLAISDHSFDYLQSPSFESGWSEDWATDYFDISLSTDVVFDGAFSVHLENSATSGFYNTLETGYYYVSFAYYFIELGSPYERFYWQNDGWNYIDLDENLNRWNLFFAYIQVDDVGTIQLYMSGATGELYIDNFKIWQANPSISTAGYSENLIESQFISWDGYQNPFVSNIETTLQLRDRCDNDLIKEWFLTTDANGVASTPFYGTLKQKEYELLAYSRDSYFSQTGHEPLEYYDLAQWSFIGGATGYSESLEDNNIVQVDFTASSTIAWLQWDHTNFDYDLVYNHILAYDLKSDTDFVTDLIYSYPSPYTGVYIANQDNKNYLANEWFEGDQLLFEWDNINSDPSWTDISYMRFTCVVVISTVYSFQLKNVHYILPQRSYFTPQLAGSLDYAETELNNAWDFSEETNENWSNTGSGSIEAQNGFLRCITGGPTNHYAAPRIVLELDSSYYNFLTLRIRSNDTTGGTYLCDVRKYDWVVIEGGNHYIDDDWTILTWDLSQSANWLDDAGLLFYLRSPTTDDYYFDIDLISLTHKDSSLSGGYMQEEFNEPFSNFKDADIYSWSSWTTSLETKQGYLEITGCSSSYIDLRNYFELDVSNYDRFEIKVRSSVSDIYFKQIQDDAYSVVSDEGDPLLTSEWQIISWEFDNDLDSSDRMFRIIFDEYGGDGSPESTDIVQIEYFRLLEDTPVNLYETPSSYFMSSENDTLQYEVFNDYQARGSYQDLELVNLNLSVSSHTFSYAAFNDLDQVGCYLPSAFYYSEYTIAESDLSSIIIYDQEGSWIDPRNFVIEVDSVRIYSDTFLISDTSSSFDLNIEDFWGNVLYYNSAESWQRYLDIQLTLYSVKIWNAQSNPIFLEITNGATWDEWVMPNEVVEFTLFGDTYDFKIYYTDIGTSFEEASANGTSVTYNYLVNSDTALVVTGLLIADVYGNLISLSDNLNLINESISIMIDQSTANITLQINAQNVDITIITTALIMLDTALSGNFTLVTDSLTILNSNMDGNFTIISNLLNLMDNTLAGNFSFITDTLSMLNTALDGNFTIISNTLNMLNTSLEGNFTLLTNILNIMDSSLDGNFTILTNLLNIIDSSLDGNFSLIMTNLQILNSSLSGNFSFITSLLTIMDSSLAANFTNIYSNFSTIYTDLLTINSSIAMDFLSVFSNQTTLLAEVINIYGNLTAVNLTMITTLLNVYADLAFEIEQLPEYITIIKLVDALGKSVEILDFNVYYSSDNVTFYPLGANILSLYNNNTFYIFINDTWGNTVLSQQFVYNPFIQITINIYELVFINRIDERCQVQIKYNSTSTWLTLWLPENAWRTLSIYAGNYDIRFLYEDNTVFRLLSDEVISSSLAYEVRTYSDFQVYSYNYSWAKDANVTLDLLANYEVFNISVWEDGVFVGTFSSLQQATWFASTVNGSHLVYFLAECIVMKITNETQTFEAWFTYSINLADSLQGFCTWIETDTAVNISIVSNFVEAQAFITHDSISVAQYNISRNFLILKSTVTGLHNITISLVYYYNASLTYTVNWKITYWVDSYYSQAIRFATTVDGFNLENSYISLDYLFVWLDGVLIRPLAPDWWNVDVEETNSINRSSIFNDWLWIRNTQLQHTLTIKDLWGNEILSLTISLTQMYVTYELPLYKLILINNDNNEVEHGFKILRYDSTLDRFVSIEIIEVPPNSIIELWITTGTYEVRSYDALYITVTDDYGQTADQRSGWAPTPANASTIIIDDGDWGYYELTFNDNFTFVDGSAEIDSELSDRIRLFFQIVIIIILVIIALIMVVIIYYNRYVKKKGWFTTILVAFWPWSWSKELEEMADLLIVRAAKKTEANIEKIIAEAIKKIKK